MCSWETWGQLGHCSQLFWATRGRQHQFNLCAYFAAQLIISEFLNTYFKQ